LDEIQYITPLRARPLYHHTDTKILGLTGTPPRDKTKQEIFNDLELNIIVQKTVDDGVDEEMISDYEIDIVFTQMSNEKNIAKTFNNNTFYVSEKSTYSYYNNKLNQAYEIGSKDISRLTLNRARFLYNLESKLICAKKIMHKYKDKRIISFSKSIDHAKILGKTAYHSKLNKKEKEHNLNLFNSKKVDSVGTVEAANTSINFIDLDIVVVHQLDSNPGNFLQRINKPVLFKPF
jgi:superfamily II DNA or RNA helicase